MIQLENKSALYTRVSTLFQADKDSLPLQRDDLVNYSKYVLNIDKYEIFEDAGYSAKNTDRPAYQQMMARLRTGEFSHLVVWKIDRISRNLIDFAEMYDELKQIGVTFVSKNEQFQTDTPMGEAMLKIILVFAELERKMTSQRVSAVMISRASRGLWNGGKVPFGYDYDRETMEFSVNQKEAAIVERIYSMYEQVPSLTSIARALNEQMLFQRSAKPWNPTTISIILKNPFYTGTYRYNVRGAGTGKSKTSVVKDESEWILVENHHPSIVDKERQDRILAILSSHRKSNTDGAKTYQRKNTHLFAGLLWCAACGSQFQSTVGKERKNGFRPSLYSCSRRRRFNDCENKSTTDISIGPFVINYIANIIKAQNSFGKTTSVETLEKKLLRGETFSSVTGIEQQGLNEMYELLKAKTEGVRFDSAVLRTPTLDGKPEADEHDLLLSEKRKQERALKRLTALYLYQENSIPETDYIVQKHVIVSAIEKVNKRLAEIDKKATTFNLTDEEFLAKASFFIMTNKLSSRRYINFNHFMQTVDKTIIKEFLSAVIQKIVIMDSKIMSITFKNGIEHKFLYG